MTCDVINNFNKLDNIQKKSKSSEKLLKFKATVYCGFLFLKVP